jgi:hypothetical protein
MGFANGEKGEMMRLIDADALYKSFGATGNCNNCPLDAYKCQYYNEHTLMEFCERIEDAPTVDAEPVKHGHWIFGHTLGHSWMKCSECLVSQAGQTACFSYCPSCGAKMDVSDTDVGKMDEPTMGQQNEVKE